MLIYLHGFRSSPLSAKATLIRRRMRELGRERDFACPQLPASPRAAIDAAMALRPTEADTVVGSSLGGFYATWIAEKTGARCVLLNPSTDPAAHADRFVGQHTMYHTPDPFEFRPEYVDELREFYAGPITRPERWFLVAAKGDELLDWRDMVARYPGARLRLLEGSDHGISDFALYVDEVLEFAGVATGAGALAPASLAPSALRVQQALARIGLESRVVELAVSARTAQEAADALGVSVGQIAKSLVFRATSSGRAVLVIAAGDNRVSEAKVAQLLGEPIERAPAAFVRERTGYAIGGIPPIGHASAMVTFIDRSLGRFPVVWAAGGTPHAVFPIAPADLFGSMDATVADVAQD